MSDARFSQQFKRWQPRLWVRRAVAQGKLALREPQKLPEPVPPGERPRRPTLKHHS